MGRINNIGQAHCGGFEWRCSEPTVLFVMVGTAPDSGFTDS